MSTKVHAASLEKIMHGSMNKYYDVTPIGRVVQKFNSEIGVFRGNLVWSITQVATNLSKAFF